MGAKPDALVSIFVWQPKWREKTRLKLEIWGEKTSSLKFEGLTIVKIEFCQDWVDCQLLIRSPIMVVVIKRYDTSSHEPITGFHQFQHEGVRGGGRLGFRVDSYYNESKAQNLVSFRITTSQLVIRGQILQSVTGVSCSHIVIIMKVEICFLLFVLHFHHHLALEHVEAQQHHHKVKIGKTWHTHGWSKCAICTCVLFATASFVDVCPYFFLEVFVSYSVAIKCIDPDLSWPSQLFLRCSCPSDARRSQGHQGLHPFGQPVQPGSSGPEQGDLPPRLWLLQPQRLLLDDQVRLQPDAVWRGQCLWRRSRRSGWLGRICLELFQHSLCSSQPIFVVGPRKDSVWPVTQPLPL